MDYDSIDTAIPTLGEAKTDSPIKAKGSRVRGQVFVSDEERVLIDSDLSRLEKRIREGMPIPSFEKAGPREKTYFDPSKLKCALVTCGGLCPGLNDIIRAMVLELHYGYGVENILGIRYGILGFLPEYSYQEKVLNPKVVSGIHEMGGSFLGTSRGPKTGEVIEKVVDYLDRTNIGILFMIGGDGTLRAASLLADEIMTRGLRISVVSVPKTIDNDIHLVSRSFGFHTAVELATTAIRGAHNEAQGHPNGIGLIRLMGRDAGFIAATATLALQDVNFTLIPEVAFDLAPPNGLLGALEDRLKERGHAVIVVAEGVKENIPECKKKDKDVGLFLKGEIVSHFKGKDIEINLKYIDPSYMIRSLSANASDNVFCSFLGRDAVHAGMAGKTRLLISQWNEELVHVPMSASVSRTKQVDPNGKLWFGVLEATGQGALKNDRQFVVPPSGGATQPKGGTANF